MTNNILHEFGETLYKLTGWQTWHYTRTYARTLRFIQAWIHCDFPLQWTSSYRSFFFVIIFSQSVLTLNNRLVGLLTRCCCPTGTCFKLFSLYNRLHLYSFGRSVEGPRHNIIYCWRLWWWYCYLLDAYVSTWYYFIVCKEWLVHEDSALAYHLQKLEG